MLYTINFRIVEPLVDKIIIEATSEIEARGLFLAHYGDAREGIHITKVEPFVATNDNRLAELPAEYFVL